jgi:HEAT repeat protein
MEKPESVDILVELFASSDPTLRGAVVRGLSWYNTPEAKAVILDAFRDNHYKVRLEAATAAEKLKLTDAVPHLIYRGKNDPEQTVKLKAFESLAIIGNREAADYLVSVIADEKMGDTLRAKAASVMLQYNFDTGITSAITVAEKSLADDKKKSIRYALGKEFAKYESPKLADICSLYLASKDVSTVGTGLDIYAKNRFSSLTDTVKGIASDEKRGALYRKAKTIMEE